MKTTTDTPLSNTHSRLHPVCTLLNKIWKKTEEEKKKINENND